MGKNGMIFFDRPKPTVGCSASGRRIGRRRRRRGRRRRKRRRRRHLIDIQGVSKMPIPANDLFFRLIERLHSTINNLTLQYCTCS
jgi:hypothetical protein